MHLKFQSRQEIQLSLSWILCLLGIKLAVSDQLNIGTDLSVYS